MESPYHPDHIFGDEDTWYDAPLGLAEQEIEEYFDALEDQNVLVGFSENKYVGNADRGHFPVIPAITLFNEIVTFVTAKQFKSVDAEYIQLKRISNKLIDLQNGHEEEIKMQDSMIDAFANQLSVIKKTPYEIDNIYTGSDCKRKRDLVVEKIDSCRETKARLEKEYIDIMSVLAKQAEEIRSKWVKGRDEQQQHARNLEATVATQRRLRNTLRCQNELEQRISGLQADNQYLDRRFARLTEENERLRAIEGGAVGLHFDQQQVTMTIDRVAAQWDHYKVQAREWRFKSRSRGEQLRLERRRLHEACRLLHEARSMNEIHQGELAEERTRISEVVVEVNQQARRMQQQASWVIELETRGMRGEIYNRSRNEWEVTGAAHKRRFDEYQGKEDTQGEARIKREDEAQGEKHIKREEEMHDEKRIKREPLD
ncbi:hypothetical protein SBOR_9179 [Sclerotinia borealis F-4128]|uniref:Uncharacterized protein n=1 Tax=Sclerotinia borealis (strain F-4128) TaxID=1432307 RepID=W9C3I6_SCLBF|nr:hypothetical protein SBOR_9179 [Sclerotinia borealis F-4128]